MCQAPCHWRFRGSGYSFSVDRSPKNAWLDIHKLWIHSDSLTWKWMAWPLGRLLSSTNSEFSTSMLVSRSVDTSPHWLSAPGESSCSQATHPIVARPITGGAMGSEIRSSDPQAFTFSTRLRLRSGRDIAIQHESKHTQPTEVK